MLYTWNYIIFYENYSSIKIEKVEYNTIYNNIKIKRIGNNTRLMPPTFLGPPCLTRDPESSTASLLPCYSADEPQDLKLSANFLLPYLHTCLYLHLYLNPFFLVQKNVLFPLKGKWDFCFWKTSLLKDWLFFNL